MLALPLLYGRAARADDRPVPPQLAFVPKLVRLYDESYGYPGYTHLDWSEAEFAASGKKRGKYWKLAGPIDGSKTAEERWASVKAAFLGAGWKLVSERGASGVLRLEAGGVESWAQADTREDVGITAIEIAPNPLTLSLAPPSPTPEKIQTDKGDFPYLPPPPGAAFKSGYEDTRPFWIQPQGAPQPELVAPKTLCRSYERPRTVSNLEFSTAYQEALAKAGWEIVSESVSADVQIIAHFAKRGRNVWANLHQNNGDISFCVADIGSDLKANLAKDCHVALYGLLFDFNKATLQPASDPVLQKVLALLQKSPSLKLQIQGHTDNVGDAAYNQTLSEARAATVVAWLTAHHIAAKRLSSKGFGKTQPVADNGTDEGRAKNRRVEIADPKCKPGPHPG